MKRLIFIDEFIFWTVIIRGWERSNLSYPVFRNAYNIHNAPESLSSNRYSSIRELCILDVVVLVSVCDLGITHIILEQLLVAVECRHCGIQSISEDIIGNRSDVVVHNDPTLECVLGVFHILFFKNVCVSNQNVHIDCGIR